jgi:hypothetical protein
MGRSYPQNREDKSMTQKSIQVLGLLGLFIILAGCRAYTHLESSKHPSYDGKTFKKILVEGRDTQQNQNIGIEWTFKRKLENQNLTIIPASDLFVPNQNYTNDQRTEILAKNEIEGILLVNLEDVQEYHIYHPPTSVSTETKKDRNGNVSIATTTHGEYTEHGQNRWHSLTLFDATTLKPIWFSKARTNGNLYWNSNQDFYNALANAAVKSLKKEHLIY